MHITVDKKCDSTGDQETDITGRQNNHGKGDVELSVGGEGSRQKYPNSLMCIHLRLAVGRGKVDARRNCLSLRFSWRGEDLEELGWVDGFGVHISITCGVDAAHAHGRVPDLVQ